MSPKHVFKSNEYNLYCHKVMRVLLLRRKKKGTIGVLFSFFPFFWLYILACILCCLSALINIHALVYKTSNCVANSCFGKFSLQIAFKF